jgi:Rrf2 family iron-sulfur cluster assembly transcriptional regulator
MMLSTKGRYAVMAMIDLATQDAGKPVTLAAIADRQEIPLAYLEQIFAKLKRQFIVQSVRGPGGGYRLAKPAEKTTIAAIVNAAEEDIAVMRCESSHGGGCTSSKTRCIAHDLWEGLEHQIEHYLSTITLADVCARRIQEIFPRETMFAEWVGKGAAVV